MSDKFDFWALIEIYGHSKIAGRVTEQMIAGTEFLRVDVPAVGNHPEYTKWLGAASIFSITPLTEELATEALKHMGVEPVSVYIPRQIQGYVRPAVPEDEEF